MGNQAGDQTADVGDLRYVLGEYALRLFREETKVLRLLEINEALVQEARQLRAELGLANNDPGDEHGD
jgi:hypothetical protein